MDRMRLVTVRMSWVVLVALMLSTAKAQTSADDGIADAHRAQLLNEAQNAPDEAQRKSACDALGGMWLSGSNGGCAGLSGNSQQPAGATGAAAGPQQQAEAGGSSCEDSKESTKNFCEPMRNLGLESEDAAGLSMLMQQAIGLGTAAATMGSSINKTCEMAMKVNLAMASINASKGAACEAAIIRCKNTCDEEKAQYDNLSAQAQAAQDAAGAAEFQKLARQMMAKKSVCNNYQTTVIASAAQAMSMAQNALASKACADATKEQAAGSPVEGPKPVDCSDANNMRSNPICICQQNPRDPVCSSGGGFGGLGGLGLGNRNTASSDGSSAGPGGSLGDGMGDFAGALAADGKGPGGPSSPQMNIPGGGGGGLAGGGGGGGGGMPDEDGGVAPGPYNTGIIQGTSGAAGGGGGYGFSGRSGGGGGGSAEDRLKGMASKFNLKNFLPKNEPYKAGVAGMAGLEKDGVTGAMGPSIWEKVSHQYRRKESSLLAP